MLDLLDIVPDLSQATPETVPRFPQLPLELWEHIIDIVAENNVHRSSDEMTKYILTCRSWIPRCRYHLFSEIVLRSRDHLHQVCKVLCSSLILRQRVKHVWIDGNLSRGEARNDADQSWISAAPFQLAPLVSELRTLKLSNFDLAQLNPTFYQALTAFTCPIHTLYLVSVRWSRYSQVARIAWATRTQNLISREYLGAVAPYWGPGVDPGISDRFLSKARVQSIEMVLRPDQFSLIPFTTMAQKHSFSFFRHLKLTVDFPEVNSHRRALFLRLLDDLGVLFEQLCSWSSPAMYPVWIVLNNEDWFVEMAGAWDVRLERVNRSLGMRHSLRTGHPWRVHDVLADCDQLMSSFSNTHFHVLKLQLEREKLSTSHPNDAQGTATPHEQPGGVEPETSLQLEASLRSQWQPIDNSLSTLRQFSTLTKVSAWVSLSPQEITFWNQFRCFFDLAERLFPRLALAKPNALCSQTQPCRLHSARRRPRQGGQ